MSVSGFSGGTLSANLLDRPSPAPGPDCSAFATTATLYALDPYGNQTLVGTQTVQSRPQVVFVGNDQCLTCYATLCDQAEAAFPYQPAGDYLLVASGWNGSTHVGVSLQTSY
jgi:hypothetical protein